MCNGGIGMEVLVKVKSHEKKKKEELYLTVSGRRLLL